MVIYYLPFTPVVGSTVPFTPFHLGPALGFGIPLRKYMHLPMFMVANVIVDVEPFFVLLLGLDYPLHGYLHTFILAFPVGLTLGYVMFLLERFFSPLYKKLPLGKDMTLNLRSFIVAGTIGTLLHVLLDSPLYSDIQPLYPLTINPLYDPSLSLELYAFCTLMGILGITFCAGLLAISAYTKLQRKESPN